VLFRYLRDNGRLFTAIVCHSPDDIGEHQRVEELRGVVLEEKRHYVAVLRGTEMEKRVKCKEEEGQESGRLQKS